MNKSEEDVQVSKNERQKENYNKFIIALYL